jgi:hypothetical protein
MKYIIEFQSSLFIDLFSLLFHILLIPNILPGSQLFATTSYSSPKFGEITMTT